jgi:hypothetical protein
MNSSEKHLNLLPARLKNLSEEFCNDVKLNQMNLSEKTLESPALKSKWVQTYLAEKQYLTVLKDAKEKLLDDYIRKHGQPGIPKKVIEARAQRESSKSQDITKINKTIEDQKQIVEYLEFTNKIILGFGFDLKAATDIIKLES